MKKVTAIVIILFCVVAYIGTNYIQQYEKRFLETEKKTQLELILINFTALATESIINGGKTRLDEMIKTVMAVNPEIHQIEIVDIKGKSLLSGNETYKTDEKLTVFKTSVKKDDEVIAYIHLFSSLSSRYTAISQHSNSLGMIVIVLLLLLTLFILFINYRCLTKPIKHIYKHLKAYLDGEELAPTKHSFCSNELILLDSTVDKLKEITANRDLLRDEMEVRIHLQLEMEKARLSAEHANSNKTDFLSFMTHEIRTPLTAIIGFSENLLDYNQSMEDRLDAIHTVINSSHHLLQLINDVLDVSKIEAGRLETEAMETNLGVLLKEVASLVRVLTKNKGLNFTVTCEEKVPETVTTDPLRLKQILINVISNAIKFTEHGAVTLALDYDAKANDLSFRVTDTGVGMTSHQKENLFKAYGQADISTAREYGGTGLGLYLSKNLAQRLGGDIHVDSEKGVGTVFSIKVSAGKIGQLISLQEDDLNKVVYTSVEQLDAKLIGKVLLADDVVENQKLICHYVKNMGVEIDVAINGQEAVEMAQLKAYDLILMDIRMPILDGIGAMRQLRAAGSKVPIISLSANNMAEDAARYIQAGFNETASKPIVRASFKQLLSKYLKAADAESNNEAPIYSALLETEPEFQDVVDVFLEKLPELIESIRNSFEQGNWDKLKDELHRVKGVSGNYGYNELMKLVAKGEFVATSKDRQAFITLFEEIKEIERRILLSVTKH